jgi:hypothetical protein
LFHIFLAGAIVDVSNVNKVLKLRQKWHKAVKIIATLEVKVTSSIVEVEPSLGDLSGFDGTIPGMPPLKTLTVGGLRKWPADGVLYIYDQSA